MQSDLSLAVGDGVRRMSYVELARVRGIGVESAERLVRRKGWLKQIGNDGRTVIFVPLAEVRKTQAKPRQKKSAPENASVELPDNTTVRRTTQGADTAVGPTIPPSAPDSLRLLEQALATLREQLERAETRATEATSRADTAERRLAELLGRSWWRRLVGR